MKVIAFSAWKNSGKDTMAAYLVEKYGATRVSFADPLKDMVAEEYGIDRKSLDDPSRKETPIWDMPVDPQDGYSKMIAEFLVKEFRSFTGIQCNKFEYKADKFFGYIMGGDESNHQLFWTPRAIAILKGSTNRSVRSNYWVQKAIEKTKNIDGLVVISDLRYKSELAQLKEAFGEEVCFVRVNRFAESPSSDPSERNLDDTRFDFYVDNTGTLDGAYSQVDEIMGRL